MWFLIILMIPRKALFKLLIVPIKRTKSINKLVKIDVQHKPNIVPNIEKKMKYLGILYL